MQNLHTENDHTFLKEIREDLNKWKTSCVCAEDNTVKM